ncbi:MAG: CDP-2,3-bis-(O-geranylgeranyl)-sn-glycerol synthase [Candidatus Asgardarchaeia archaeon]
MTVRKLALSIFTYSFLGTSLILLMIGLDGFMRGLVVAFFFIMPAYFANGSAPVFGKGGHPIDRGKKFKNGFRILGDGKTWEGSVGGFMVGTFTGYLLYLLRYDIYNLLTKCSLEASLEVLDLLNKMFPFLSLTLSFGAIFGDMVGAFFKRRLGLPRGAPFLFLDQLDFLIFAILLSIPYYSLRLEALTILLVLTPAVHLLSNIGGYLLKLKKEPW